MESTNIQNTIVQSIIDNIKQDHYNLLYTIYHKYGTIGKFTFKELLILYPFKHINLYQIQKLDSNYTKINQINQITKSNQQCMSRCWGNGSYKIKFDQENNIWSIGSYITYYQNNNTWIYGTQCKRTSINKSQYCGIHLKQLDTEYSALTHGRIDLDPPHHHYDKYRQKILMNIAIYKQKNNL